MRKICCPGNVEYETLSAGLPCSSFERDEVGGNRSREELHRKGRAGIWRKHDAMNRCRRFYSSFGSRVLSEQERELDNIWSLFMIALTVT